MRGVLGLVALVALVRRGLLMVTVQGASMHPTLRDGDRVLAVRIGRLVRWVPGRPTVVGRVPESVGDGTPQNPWLFVKRLIGHGGAAVRVPRSRLQPDADVERFGGRTDGSDVRWPVPPGHCFVKGDGPGSADSVSWGPIPYDHLVGVVALRLSRSAAAQAGSSSSTATTGARAPADR